MREMNGVLADFLIAITESKIREFEREDPLSKNLIAQLLCKANYQRAFFSTVLITISAVIMLIFTFISLLDTQSIGQIIRVIGGFVLLISLPALIYLLRCEQNKRDIEIRRINFFVILFWTIFTLGMLLIVISEFMSIGSSIGIFVYFSVIMIFPLQRVRATAAMCSAFLLGTIVSGIAFSVLPIYLLIYLFFAMVCVLTSAIVYSSYCCLWISDRQLNIANERCRQINEKDALTGLLNKKGLVRRLMEIIDRGTQKNIAAIFFDIDDFRRYNQIYTDTESDECLYNICNCIRIISKPRTEIISRYAGDDFVIVLENIEEFDLVSFAEQIRKSVETMSIPFENGKSVTVTVGVSSIIEGEFTDYSELLKQAERSLALAKNDGKNCVGYMNTVFHTK